MHQLHNSKNLNEKFGRLPYASKIAGNYLTVFYNRMFNIDYILGKIKFRHLKIKFYSRNTAA